MTDICSDIVKDPVWGPFFNGHAERKGGRSREIESVVIDETDLDSSVHIISPAESGESEATRGTDPLQPLYPMIENICLDNIDKLSEILASTRSPLIETTDLSKLLLKMEENIDNLSPPSVGLDINGLNSDSDYFWLLMYAAWRYRLNDAKFIPFAKDNVLDGARDKAEDILGNLILHSLQSIELRFRWLEPAREAD